MAERRLDVAVPEVLAEAELTAVDMAAITGLERGVDGRHGADPKTMDWIPR